jgi:hypothetical protein
MATVMVAGAALSSQAQEAREGRRAAALPPDSNYVERTIREGDRWRLVQASGQAVDDDGRYFDMPLYMIQDAAGVRNAPLSEALKADLLRLRQTEADNQGFVLSQEIVDEISASEQAGQLSPALWAIAEPEDPDIEPMELLGAEASTLRLFGKCKDKVINKNKTFDVRTPITRTFDFGSGFSGTLALSGNAQGTGTGEIQVRLKRYAVFGVCIPYGVRFDHVRAFGNVTATVGATLSGTVTYVSPDPADPGNRKAWEWEITKPHLFSFAFAIGPIPVWGGFNLPVTAGAELKASVTGSITYNGGGNLSGYFDYVCTLDACNGYSSFNTTNLPVTQPWTGGVSGRIEPSLYAQVAVRGYLYGEGFAYAQVGLRPYLHGDLWGYYGNNCGDTEGDGFYETVDGLTFDLDWQVWVTAQADSFLTKEKRWKLFDIFGRRHIAFWDLIGSSALHPQLWGPATAPVNTSQLYSLKMRPCWPYPDSVDYRLSWGDGVQTPYSGPAPSWVQASHVWASPGTKRLDLVALRDSHGRHLDKTTTRNVEVTGVGGSAAHLGMTWSVIEQRGAYVHVGSDNVTNPYSGDTSANAALPILCLRQDGRDAPTWITFDFYNGWAAGEVRLTAPVPGSTLTSRAVADAMCATAFGGGYRMAEFHDGGGGWTWWAQGVPNPTSRFWVAIDDQLANCWN